MTESTVKDSTARLSFMVPIVLFVLFFAISCGVIAAVFLRAAAETRHAEQYSAAVQLCRNQAEICRSRTSPEAEPLQTLYFSADFESAPQEAAVYFLTVAQEVTQTESGLLCSNIITAHSMDGTQLYSLEAAVYLPGSEEG